MFCIRGWSVQKLIFLRYLGLLLREITLTGTIDQFSMNRLKSDSWLILQHMTCRNFFKQQNVIKCKLNFPNSNFKCKGIVNDPFGGRFFVFKCLIIYIFFIFVYEFWYFYVPLYGSDIIMMGYIVSVVILTLLDFLIILLAKKVVLYLLLK